MWCSRGLHDAGNSLCESLLRILPAGKRFHHACPADSVAPGHGPNQPISLRDRATQWACHDHLWCQNAVLQVGKLSTCSASPQSGLVAWDLRCGSWVVGTLRASSPTTQRPTQPFLTFRFRPCTHRRPPSSCCPWSLQTMYPASSLSAAPLQTKPAPPLLLQLTPICWTSLLRGLHGRYC